MGPLTRAEITEQIISTATTFRRVQGLDPEATVLVVWPGSGHDRAGLQRAITRLDRHITLTEPRGGG